MYVEKMCLLVLAICVDKKHKHKTALCQKAQGSNKTIW